jgi:hypothetical protein
VRTSSFLSRRPARLRLALIYSGLFLLAGAVLLAITYGLAANSLPTSASQIRGNPAGSTGLQACEASAVSAGQIAQCKKEAAQVAQGDRRRDGTG